MLFFQFSSTYDVIPLENFEKKIVSFNPTKDYVIYSYYIPASQKYTTYYHQIEKIYFGNRYMIQDIYVYENLSQIRQDAYGDFINYVRKSYFRSYSSSTGFQDSFYKNKTYYFVIKNSQKLNETMNFTLSIYTTEKIAILHDFIQTKMSVFINGTYNYNIHIPLDHKKYILFEIRTNMVANMTLKDNNEKIVSENNTFSGVGYYELKDGYSYNINLIFKGYGFKDGIIYFYFIQSKYTKFFPLLMNLEYFQHLYVNRKLKLLLDLSSIKKGDMIWVQYYKYWGWFNTFKLNYYNTDDEDIIEKTEGKEITLSYDESCTNNICKEYIHKNSDDIKVVIFEVPSDNIDTIFYFDIKYGYPEKYRLQKVYISIIIGIALSIPNLIIQMIKWDRDKHCRCHYKCALILDLLLHMAYGCIFSVISYLGGKSSLIIGFIFLGAFVFILLINILLFFKKIPSMFTGLACLLQKFKHYRTFEKAFNERRKLPPQIILNNNKEAIYDDENKENNNNYEYKYCSWEDCTDFILNKDNPILECHFNYSVHVDNETREDLENLKKNLEDKETTNGDNVLNNKIYYTHYLVPNFNENEICYLKPINSKDKFLVFLWFLLFFTGYLDIYEIFICYKTEEVNIRIVKKVSKKKKFRNSYKLNDPKFEDNIILNKKEINDKIENEDIKIEPILNNMNEE